MEKQVKCHLSLFFKPKSFYETSFEFPQIFILCKHHRTLKEFVLVLVAISVVIWFHSQTTLGFVIRLSGICKSNHFRSKYLCLKCPYILVAVIMQLIILLCFHFMIWEENTMNIKSVRRAMQFSARFPDPLVFSTRVMVTSKWEDCNLLCKTLEIQNSSKLYEVMSALHGMLNKQ